MSKNQKEQKNPEKKQENTQKLSNIKKLTISKKINYSDKNKESNINLRTKSDNLDIEKFIKEKADNAIKYNFKNIDEGKQNIKERYIKEK